VKNIHLCEGNEIHITVGAATVKITCGEIGNADGTFLGLIVDLPRTIECKLWQKQDTEPEEGQTDYITIPLVPAGEV